MTNTERITAVTVLPHEDTDPIEVATPEGGYVHIVDGVLHVVSGETLVAAFAPDCWASVTTA